MYQLVRSSVLLSLAWARSSDYFVFDRKAYARAYSKKRRQSISWKEWNEKHKRKIRQFLCDYKTGKPCHDCKGLFPHYVLDFDHRNPTEKTDKMSRIAWISIKRLQEEIPKCDLVCANCHRIRTFTRTPTVTQPRAGTSEGILQTPN